MVLARLDRAADNEVADVGKARIRRLLPLEGARDRRSRDADRQSSKAFFAGEGVQAMRDGLCPGDGSRPVTANVAHAQLVALRLSRPEKFRKIYRQQIVHIEHGLHVFSPIEPTKEPGLVEEELAGVDVDCAFGNMVSERP